MLTKDDWKEIEYGGWIFKLKECEYTYYEPIAGKSGAVSGFPVKKPDGAVAWYHTHNNPSWWLKWLGTDGEKFSYPRDIRISDYNNSDGYLGTPSGQIQKYDPSHGQKGWKHGTSIVDQILLKPNHK